MQQMAWQAPPHKSTPAFQVRMGDGTCTAPGKNRKNPSPDFEMSLAVTYFMFPAASSIANSNPIRNVAKFAG
jgi:hypothetical protein